MNSGNERQSRDRGLMKTEIVSTTQDAGPGVNRAISLLRAGELVALPTETVYGLAGDALEPEAVIKIFEAKNRPFFDPLIVHVPDRDWLGELVEFNAQTRPIVDELLNQFWPGPLTILLPKKSCVPDLVTAGLDEVAVRQPRHPVFLEVLRQFGKPLAAPSANRFGRISPTTALHVYEELNGRIRLILDAGPASVGLESTVIRVRENRIEVLRPGPITDEELEKVALVLNCSDPSKEILAPGQMSTHYAPGKEVLLFFREDQECEPNSGLICWGEVRYQDRFKIVRSLSETRNLHEAAQRLFGLLRKMDGEEIEKIYFEPVPEKSIGKAIMNRIKRAAGPRP